MAGLGWTYDVGAFKVVGFEDWIWESVLKWIGRQRLVPCVLLCLLLGVPSFGFLVLVTRALTGYLGISGGGG